MRTPRASATWSNDRFATWRGWSMTCSTCRASGAAPSSSGAIEAGSGGTQEGSTFVVRLPLAAAATASSAIADDTVDAQAPIRVGRVMVVDDNADALHMLVEALKTAGLDAFGASRSTEAL